MNGIENILRRIQSDTQTEVDAILNAARKEAEEIDAQGRAQAESERAALAVRYEKAAVEREERLVSVARMEARQVSLAARQEMVAKAYDLALEKLCALPEEEYVRVTAGLLTKAAPDGRGEVAFSPELKDGLGERIVAQANQALGGKLTLSKEKRPIRGGFILKNGNVEVNGSFETLLRLQRGETEAAVAKLLFP